MTLLHMKITFFFLNFLYWSQGAFICVFVISRGGYIAQWHRSTQVVQHSRDGQSAERWQPPHQQTDGRGGARKAPGTLQWKVGPENCLTQSSFHSVWENICWGMSNGPGNFSHNFNPFLSWKSYLIDGFLSQVFRMFINCWWASWLYDVILICGIRIVWYLPTAGHVLINFNMFNLK